MLHLSVFRIFWKPLSSFFHYKMRYLGIARKRIHYSCEDGIEKSIPRDHHFLSHPHTHDRLFCVSSSYRHGMWLWHFLVILTGFVCHLRFPFDSILEAVFTVSPKRQYLGIVKPTTPATTEPVCKPGRNIYTLIFIFNRNANIISINLTKMSNFGDCPIHMVRKCFD